MKIKKELNLKNIKKKQSELGLNQSAIAKELKISRETVSKWLKNIKFPRPGKLLALSKILKLKYDEIVNEEYQNKPVICFRKFRNSKLTEEHQQNAYRMAVLLEKLIPYLPFKILYQPPRLKKIKSDYKYLQTVVRDILDSINIKGRILKYTDLIDFFNNFQTILIPVLWGECKERQNGLHIYLPESTSTWVYLNLDCKIFDFKFWMAHELGHVISLNSENINESEYFADKFASSLLFPETIAEVEYNKIIKIRLEANKVNYLKKIASYYVISPITIFNEINSYAKHYNKSELNFKDKNKIYKINTNLYKNYDLLSRDFFKNKLPTAKQYINLTKKTFKSVFYDSVSTYIKENDISLPAFLKNILNSSIIEAKSLSEVLMSE